MRRVVLFGEDLGHEKVLESLLNRLARAYRVPVNIDTRSTRGGHERALTELGAFLRELAAGNEVLPDLIVAAIDANCAPLNDKISEIKRLVPIELIPFVVCAVPDPHVERWLLIDSHAFKEVLGQECDAPAQKCERGYYKTLLGEAVRKAGVNPLLGGMEYAEDIIQAMDLDMAQKTDKSFKRTISGITGFFKKWQQLLLHQQRYDPRSFKPPSQKREASLQGNRPESTLGETW